ncbi:hypothetical protein [Jiangella alkaliphila]|uniref:Homeodomain-like domain-containing protein n=1 Tax=Jiangella alkaliphila TaxID=419479 RepID=A0A1H2L8L8_9ACTN|nr:hypothetical protein [Jiangella alkaliphila]SDU76806.1 hypothetical protein SAMN04488563_5322 [Jiangella alkaliphila]
MEWRVHVAPAVAVSEVEQAADDVVAANGRLNEAVAAARAAGATWERIGAAVGITRRAANERWG